ncbi:hypothetical protein BDV06DRAFT_231909 [Aspergillus oleicola]
MYADTTQPPAPLPQPQLTQIQPGLSLLRPLSRRGHGPGLVLLSPDSTDQVTIRDGVPSSTMKWAEEGYTVVEIQASAVQGTPGILETAVAVLEECDVCDNSESVGLVSYDQVSWAHLTSTLPSISQIAGAIIYADYTECSTPNPQASVPLLVHWAGRSSKLPTRTPKFAEYFYPLAPSSKFATPFTDDFTYTAEAVSHSRNLAFLKPLLGGPYFDLEAIWDEHTHYEFYDRSVEHTMATMVQEPYVNHIPTLTGGIGREELTYFYRHHFIFQNSPDTELELVSRTIGIDRVVDEFIFKTTHDQAIDWLIPGILPTGVSVEVPMTAVVNIRGDRLYHEHIAWDQGSVLRQLGLLPEYLGYPDRGSLGGRGQVEYRVPVTGVETAQKMREKGSVASNKMFEFRVRKVEKD